MYIYACIYVYTHVCIYVSMLGTCGTFWGNAVLRYYRTTKPILQYHISAEDSWKYRSIVTYVITVVPACMVQWTIISSLLHRRIKV